MGTVDNAQGKDPRTGKRMHMILRVLQSLCLLLIISIPSHGLGAVDAGNAGSDVLIVAGIFTDAQKKQVKDAELLFSLTARKSR